ncbi:MULTISPECIES: FixH family protein [Bacillaceae]|uniref:FixH family protein n=1 Tax=Bacillaceae TaxID=186817 RepID=UPI0005A763B0|nr:FixH family protein [Bacillus rubiinfantis]
MKKNLFLLLCLLIALEGCSKTDNTAQKDEVPALLEVAIKTPDIVNAKEEVKIEAIVTQGEDKVNDAEEVNFEIWKEGQEKHARYIGKSQGKGIYSINNTFSEEGKYYIVAHVTARDMHNMPKKEITVGSEKAPTE